MDEDNLISAIQRNGYWQLSLDRGTSLIWLRTLFNIIRADCKEGWIVLRIRKGTGLEGGDFLSTWKEREAEGTCSSSFYSNFGILFSSDPHAHSLRREPRSSMCIHSPQSLQLRTIQTNNTRCLSKHQQGIQLRFSKQLSRDRHRAICYGISFALSNASLSSIYLSLYLRKRTWRALHSISVVLSQAIQIHHSNPILSLTLSIK